MRRQRLLGRQADDDHTDSGHEGSPTKKEGRFFPSRFPIRAKCPAKLPTPTPRTPSLVRKKKNIISVYLPFNQKTDTSGPEKPV